ncbi:hypothetical protein AMC99_01493 [Altererythrobacter epoxidivorans]|uniref:Uncharacterized protein n=1 Tax=Altererythrobacter epoxidivorans TaxID=361183 RepID=A0A0M4M870_9SPHN|nr:hypothetical protein AMC99_01493 [Altererythrobacter epoxidivorans]
MSEAIGAADANRKGGSEVEDAACQRPPAGPPRLMARKPSERT